MRIHADTLISYVLGALGESPSPTSAFAGEREGLQLRELVRQLLPEAAAKAVMEAPRAILDDFSHFGESIGRLGKGAGYVMLPDDFLRLVSFRMSDWLCSVTEPAEEGSALYRLQSSPCPGVRGQWHRPVCRITQRSVGRVLEFYSCRSEEAEVVEANYIAKPTFDASGYMRLPAACLAATINLTVEEFGMLNVELI